MTVSHSWFDEFHKVLNACRCGRAAGACVCHRLPTGIDHLPPPPEPEWPYALLGDRPDTAR